MDKDTFECGGLNEFHLGFGLLKSIDWISPWIWHLLVWFAIGAVRYWVATMSQTDGNDIRQGPRKGSFSSIALSELSVIFCCHLRVGWHCNVCRFSENCKSDWWIAFEVALGSKVAHRTLLEGNRERFGFAVQCATTATPNLNSPTHPSLRRIKTLSSIPQVNDALSFQQPANPPSSPQSNTPLPTIIASNSSTNWN